VTVVEDAEAINGLLDAAFPDSMLRPGHPMVTAWYGIWSDGHLVACAADRSTRQAEPSVGVLGAIAVHPEQRRHGWGAAVTAGLTEVLRTRHPLVALGVVAGNDPATRLYVRLGFTGVHEVTAITPSQG
jgi:predicted GNAT family acetyltransferase